MQLRLLRSTRSCRHSTHIVRLTALSVVQRRVSGRGFDRQARALALTNGGDECGCGDLSRVRMS